MHFRHEKMKYWPRLEYEIFLYIDREIDYCFRCCQAHRIKNNQTLKSASFFFFCTAIASSRWLNWMKRGGFYFANELTTEIPIYWFAHQSVHHESNGLPFIQWQLYFIHCIEMKIFVNNQFYWLEAHPSTEYTHKQIMNRKKVWKTYLFYFLFESRVFNANRSIGKIKSIILFRKNKEKWKTKRLKWKWDIFFFI